MLNVLLKIIYLLSKLFCVVIPINHSYIDSIPWTAPRENRLVQCFSFLVKDRHLLLYELHKRHGRESDFACRQSSITDDMQGQFVRWGPNRISVNTPSSLQPIYGFKANTRKADFSTIWNMLFASPRIGTFIDPVQHKRQKPIMQLALTDNAVKEMEEHILSHTRIFCNAIAYGDEEFGLCNPRTEKKAWSVSEDLKTIAGFLAYNIMGDIAFGQSFHTQKEAKNRHYVDLSIQGFRGLSTVSENLGNHNVTYRNEKVAYMRLLLRLKLDRLFFHKLHRGLEGFKQATQEAASKRVERPKVKIHDIFSFLLMAGDLEADDSLFILNL